MATIFTVGVLMALFLEVRVFELRFRALSFDIQTPNVAAENTRRCSLQKYALRTGAIHVILA